MTAVLILLCLAIAGRELYMAFDRKRTDEAGDAGLAETRHRVAELTRLVEARDARMDSLISQVNDRMLPEVNSRFAEQREAADRLRAELDRLRDELRRESRAQLRARLDQAVAASLGADAVDTVLGVLGGEVPGPARTTLAEAYEKCALSYALRVELAEPDGGAPWQTRYYLSGPSPRELERAFLDLVRGLRSGTAGPADPLLSELRQVEDAVAQLGPLLLVRTPQALLCGVRPLADLLRNDPGALPADPAGAAARVRRLPTTRFCDLSTWQPRSGGPARDG